MTQLTDSSDLPKKWEGRNFIDNLVKQREDQARFIKVTQDLLSKYQRKRTIDGGEKVNKVVDFHVSNYVLLLQYPTEQVGGPLSRSFDYHGYRTY